MKNKAPLILVDGSSYLYRAFHALPPLVTSSGHPTGAVKGVIAMMRRMMKDFPDSPIVVIFDAKGKTFRDDLYVEYKSHRPPMPDDLRLQIEPIHKIIEAMGLPMLIIDGVEADDVIGTLAVEAASQQRNVVISTGDKDMAQLVGPYVSLINTMTNTHMDRQGVVDKFGIPPELIIDYLALVGDKSDNIPGVPGVGEKTALAILQGIGGFADIYKDVKKIADLEFRGAKNIPDKMLEHKELADLSYKLATIKINVQLEQTLDDLVNVEPDNDKLLLWFNKLELKTWANELAIDKEQRGNSTALIEPKEKNYQIIYSEDQLDSWLEKMKLAEYFSFDTETTSLDYMQAKIVGLSFSVTPYEAAYVPLAHDYLGAPEQLNREQVLQKIKPLLENPSAFKVGQNLKYDMNVLGNYGITLSGIKFDTMLESYAISSIGSRHDMDSLALKYLEEKTIHFEDVVGKGVGQLTFNQVPIETAAPYAAEDADVTLRLHQAIFPMLKKQEGLLHVFNAIEIPLIPVLSRMERNGALVDAKLLNDQSQELGIRLEEIEKEAYQLAGEKFNLASPKQLGEVLFEKLNIPILKKTAKGAPSTKEEVLTELALDYPLPKILLEHRTLSKLKSTYADKLPKMISPVTGRIHTSYHQAVTATGRLSSSDPNLQNIPIRTAEGRRIRQAFIAPTGSQILAADYSQIELRIMAHLSGDKGLTDAFLQGLDVHQATAAEVFGVALDKVTTDQRRSAKAINFGLIYGMSAFGLGRQLHIGRHQAQEYIDKYFARYPGVKDYMDNTRRTAAEKGCVETLFGRRLYLPEINSSNGMRRQAAERTAINAPMQGTAADIIKLAMIDVDSWLAAAGLRSKMIMQVHDELVLEVPESEVDMIIDGLRNRMSAVADLSVPLLVDLGKGDNWDEAH
ncbi:MAG: DNA polymerase-1 [Porticoccus sp.]|jgi:DNA polymerase-1